MLLALRAVERNQGAAGVDGMTTGQLRGHLRQHWGQIKAQLLAGSYQPHLMRRVDIPKPGGGGTRMQNSDGDGPSDPAGAASSDEPGVGTGLF